MSNNYTRIQITINNNVLELSIKIYNRIYFPFIIIRFSTSIKKKKFFLSLLQKTIKDMCGIYISSNLHWVNKQINKLYDANICYMTICVHAHR